MAEPDVTTSTAAGCPSPGPEAQRIVWLDSVDSTNTEALRRLAAGDQGPLWIAARRQTGGKGRAGRRWVSEPGNLFATHLCTFAVPPETAAQLSLVAGVALHEAISGLAPGLPLVLKWPNDLLCNAAKLSGVLIESQALPGGRLAVTIGIGLNLAHHPQLPDRRTTSLAVEGFAVAPGAALTALARSLAIWLANWRQGQGFRLIRAAWLERSLPIGSTIGLVRDGERLEGTFAGLGDKGALLIEAPPGHRQEITFGDVEVGGPAPATGKAG